MKINVGSEIKNPEILKLVPNYFKTKKICKYAVKRLSFVIRYVADQYKTQKMCGKAVLENSRTSEYVTGQYKTQEICDRLVSKDLFMLKIL